MRDESLRTDGVGERPTYKRKTRKGETTIFHTETEGKGRFLKVRHPSYDPRKLRPPLLPLFLGHTSSRRPSRSVQVPHELRLRKGHVRVGSGDGVEATLSGLGWGSGDGVGAALTGLGKGDGPTGVRCRAHTTPRRRSSRGRGTSNGLPTP